MRLFTSLISTVLVGLMLTSYSALASSGGLANENFHKQVCFTAGATGSGSSLSDAAPLATAKTILVIQPGFVIQAVDVVVTTAVTGSSPQIIVGDGDSSNGFVTTSGVTEGTPGVYHGDGSYISTGANKYYSALKSVLYTNSGTLSAGSICIVVSGYKL